MKKLLLSISVAACILSSVTAQTVILNNGPIFDLAGGGFGGANASTLHDGLTTYGVGHAVSSGFRVAEDFTIPAGETWMIDSLVFFGYQTGSGVVSSISAVNVQIWNGSPGAPSSVIHGDPTTDVMITTEYVGTYRTGDAPGPCFPATCVDRPIMRNATTIGATLSTGTYWIDWQTNGTLASGPWAPPINLGAGVVTTGNARQYDPAAMTWNPLTDGGTLTGMGLPFLVVGTVFTGINEVSSNNNVSIFPNPVKDKATIRINLPTHSGDLYTFTVYNVLGSQVRKIENINESQFTFNRNSLPNGLYIYELTRGNTIVSNGKLILQ